MGNPGAARAHQVSYAVAVAAVAAAWLIRWRLDPLLGDNLPFPTFFLAMVFAAWYGGLRPALLTMGLGLFIAWYYFIPPRHSFHIVTGRHAVVLVTFLIVSAAIALFGESIRAAQRRVAEQNERLRTTLASIGDGVITTDAAGRVTSINPVAESLTGWKSADAVGARLSAVFCVVSETTRQPVESPVTRVLHDGVSAGLANHALLIARDGTERPIDDSSSPIRSREGEILGCVLVFRDVSERRRRERDLEESEQRFRSLAESIPQLVWMAHADGHIFWYNSRWYAYTGATPEQMEGWGWQSVHDPEVLPQVLERWRASLRTGETFDMVFPLRGKDGVLRPFLTRVVPIKDDAGRVTRWFGTNTDITDRKHSEEQLRRNHDTFFSLIQNNPFGVYVIDADFRLRQVSLGAQKVFASVRPLLGRDFAEVLRILWVEPFASEVIARFRHTLRTGEPYNSPSTIEHRQDIGELEAYDWRIERIEMPDGRHGVVCYFYDLSDRQRWEAALRQSEERLRLGVQVAGLALTDVDYATDRYHLTAEAARLFGLGATAMTVPRQAVHATFHPDDRAELARVIAESLDPAGHGSFVLDHRVVWPDGQVRWLHVSKQVRFQGEGGARRPLRATLAALDITELKQAEEQLRLLTTELSQADRRKDEFLATLAHELRNPLAPLRNGVRLIRAPESSRASLAQVGAMMERQLGHMVHLVDDLLDVSRISRGKIELRKVRLALATVVNTAVETSRPVIEASGHTLEVSLPPAPLYVDADLTRLGQVFANLLHNAAKYSERGGRIWLTAAQQGDAVVISVRDTGIGIPPEMLPRIFEMFTQVDRSLEMSQGGLGIGLTLVKRLVEMHEGSVEARSDGQGKGSELFVRLPLVPSAPQKETAMVDEEHRGPAAPRRILVADDNRDAADSMAELLEILGNDVRTANDGQQALEVAAAFRPEVILLDIGMPKLNGHEACRRIRAEPWGKGAVLIALTGWGQDKDRQQSQEAGFDHHLVKPVDPEVLEKLLAGLATKVA